jgi:hypothetical protein
MKVFLTHDELSERNRTVFSYMLAERNIMLGKWFTYISGSGLFMWQNYYGHGPLNGLTKKERTFLNMKEILAWNKWKTDET